MREFFFLVVSNNLANLGLFLPLDVTTCVRTSTLTFMRQAYDGTPGWCVGTPVAASVRRDRNRWTLSTVGLLRAIARGKAIHARNVGAVKGRAGQARPGRHC